jgi:Urea transporter
MILVRVSSSESLALLTSLLCHTTTGTMRIPRVTMAPVRFLVSKSRVCCYRIPRFHNANTFRSCRFFSSVGKPDSDQSAVTTPPPPQLPPPLSSSSLLWTSSWTGVGQVIFLQSDTAGKIILASLAVGDPFLASLAALGSVSATAMAQVAHLDQESSSSASSMTRAGLYSYNGCLVGCAASVFLTGSGIGATAIVTPLTFTILDLGL